MLQFFYMDIPINALLTKSYLALFAMMHGFHHYFGCNLRAKMDVTTRRPAANHSLVSNLFMRQFKVHIPYCVPLEFPCSQERRNEPCIPPFAMP